MSSNQCITGNNAYDYQYLSRMKMSQSLKGRKTWNKGNHDKRGPRGPYKPKNQIGLLE